MNKHDYRMDRREGAGAELVVRKGNKYGAALPGDHVLVDIEELNNRSTMQACMTVADYEKVLEERAARARESEHPKKSQVSAAVDAGLERIRENALKRQREIEEQAKNAPPQPPEPKPENSKQKPAKKK